MYRTKLLVSLVLLLTASVVCLAQDSHFDDSPAKALFQQSAWAHGYMHGYESGFHFGNLDLHMARSARNPHMVKEYNQASHSYRQGYGDRTEFDCGYRSGFEVGYLDGESGRSFRAATVAQNLASDLDLKVPAKRSKSFDGMMESGYTAGRRSGLSDARAQHNFDPSKARCPEESKSAPVCDAYQIGYRWGYSDGFTNQRPELETQRASR